MNWETSSEQDKKMDKFRREHECSVKNNQGAIGGRSTYEFTPTGLGVITVIQCACGEKKDVTDYDHW